MESNPRVAIYTLRDVSRRFGSTLRPLWEADGLRKNGFVDFRVCSGKLNGNPKLVHAHQDAMYHVGSFSYIADLHGLSWVTYLDSVAKLPFSLAKLRNRFVRVPRRRRKEEEAYMRAKYLVCASASIAEAVEHLNRTEVVRNAVSLDRYLPTMCQTLRVAVAGPFVEGHENVYALQMLLRMLRIDTSTEYLVIGPIDQSLRDELARYSNVTVEPGADNFSANDFISALRTCSVLLCPYPSYVWNGFGGTKIKAIEAAACSLSLVGTHSGIADFSEDAVLFGESPEELVDRVLYLKDDRARQRLGQKARREVEQYHNNVKESKRLIPIYTELLA
jgi:glycosyltransferase involved in cell wall biosynthesis